jgi:hypothetical protein
MNHQLEVALKKEFVRQRQEHHFSPAQVVCVTETTGENGITAE